MPIAIPAIKEARAPAPASGAAQTSATAPVQFPRNPARLAVAARDTPSGPSSRPASSSRRVSQPSSAPSPNSASIDAIGEPSEAALREDAETLKRARMRKAQLQKKVERWMDVLSEDTVGRETFKRAAAHLTPPQYHEILHERHLNSLCSYPLCSNLPTAPYSSRRKFIISTSKRSIDPASGNEHEGFCGKKCRTRSKWVEGRLKGEAVWLRDLRGLGREEGGGVELLEEVEERGEMPSLEDVGRRASEASANANDAPTAPAALRPQQIIAPAKQPLLAEGAELKPGPNAVTDLINSLMIHERPVSAPGAPPQAEQVPVAQPLPLPLPRPTSAVKSSRALNAREQRRDQASLIAAPATLTRSVLSAAQAVPSSVRAASGGADPLTSSSTPGEKSKNRGGPGQESEEEESDEESDWEKEMSFGPEDEEMRGLFEEAEKAREMAKDGEEGTEEGA
ncbi:hypothetical protein IAR50_005613 [Cryptococcus sp. DSM 104548]